MRQKMPFQYRKLFLLKEVAGSSISKPLVLHHCRCRSPSPGGFLQTKSPDLALCPLTLGKKTYKHMIMVDGSIFINILEHKSPCHGQENLFFF
jgi:hypothetical protein